MDTTQLLLSTAVTITTVLLIIISIQLMSLLKQLKKDHVVKKPEHIPASEKKDKVIKKKTNLQSLLEQIKVLTPHRHSAKKKFFKSS